MKGQLIFIGSFLFTLCLIFDGCKETTETTGNNAEKFYGNVKSVKQTKYVANDKFGELTKQKIEPKDDVSDRSEIIHILDFYEYQFVDGKIVESKSFYLDGNIRYEHKYDRNDNIILSVVYDKNGFLTDSTTRKYDTKNNLRESSHYSGTGKLMGKDIVKYISGREVERKVYKYQGELENIIRTKYENRGRRVIEYNYRVYDGVTFKSVSEFDSKGNEIEHHTFRSDTVTLSSSDYCKYNKSGKLVEYKSDRIGDEYVSQHEYNNRGLVINDKTCFGPNDKNPSVQKYEYKFDENGNWIEKIEYKNNIPKYIYERIIKYY